MANVVLGMPTMGSVQAKTFEALFKIDRNEHKIFPLMTEYSLIYLARDNIAKRMLENPEADYLWFVDSDIIVDKYTLNILVVDDVDIVSAVYPHKDDTSNSIVGFGMGYEALEKGKRADLEQVSRVGMGCCLIKRKVIEKVIEEYNSCFNPMSNLGEDFSFCERARSLGFKIYIDWNMKCGHVGTKVYEV